jgi:RNA polymerase sigma-70 factor (ECF subfamily)
MKGNTMALSLDKSVRLSRQAAAVEPEKAVELGNKELFLHLLMPIKKYLYNFIQKSLNFSHEADDIFQETLLKSFRYFNSFKQDKNFKTWIFTIAHNLMKDYFKSINIKNSNSNLVLMESADKIASDNEASLHGEVQEIYNMAEKLKPRHREVFFLYYYNEFKISEIVEITGLTTVNVKFILHQARKFVKKMLEVSE